MKKKKRKLSIKIWMVGNIKYPFSGADTDHVRVVISQRQFCNLYKIGKNNIGNRENRNFLIVSIDTVPALLLLIKF